MEFHISKKYEITVKLYRAKTNSMGERVELIVGREWINNISSRLIEV